MIFECEVIWGHRGQEHGLSLNILNHVCHIQYKTLKSFAHIEANWPVLPELTQIWSQMSLKVISGTSKMISDKHIHPYLSIWRNEQGHHR